MNRLTRFAHFGIALATAFVAFSFSSCKNDEDFVDALAVYKSTKSDTEDSTDESFKVVFYDDYTFLYNLKWTETSIGGDKKVIKYDLNVAQGTWSGSSPTGAGTVTCKVTKVIKKPDLDIESSNNTRFLFGLFGGDKDDNVTTKTTDDYGTEDLGSSSFEQTFTISSDCKTTFNGNEKIPLFDSFRQNKSGITWGSKDKTLNLVKR